MRDPFCWSIGFARWRSCQIRLHVFFLAFCAATFYLWWPASTSRAAVELFEGVAAGLAVLFASVLLHELSHWLVARRHGITVDAIVIGPLGGLSAWPRAADAKSELAFLAAGPLSNLIMCLVCASVLVIRDPGVAFASLFNPLQPAWVVGGPPLKQGLMLALWVNWLLFLINILPAYPFDGGRMVRALLLLARPELTRKQVAETVFWLAVVLALGILAVALVLWKHAADAPFPAWFPLVLLAVVLLVSARRDVEDAYAAAQPATCVIDDGAGPAPAPPRAETFDPTDLPLPDDLWEACDLEERSITCSEEVEAREERQVDGILTQLHAHGMESLSMEDRQLLERVSARLRSRMGKRR